MTTEGKPGQRRLIVITYHFPPDGSIGGQRWGGLTKYLARLGWEIHVITASPVEDGNVTPGVRRHVHRRRRSLDDAYRKLSSRFRDPLPRRSDPPSGYDRRTKSAGVIYTLRRIVVGAMYLPDSARGWAVRAGLAARALLRHKKFDLVVTSGPPHSAHFAGLIATTGRDERFWIDMRDPWSHTHAMHLPEDRFIRGERYFLRRLERLVFPRASRILVNTREFASALRAAEPNLDVEYFPNGIDLDLLPRRDTASVERGSIAYVGALYGSRNLSTLIAAMGALLRDRKAATSLRLHIAGPLDSPHREQMQSDIAAADVGGLVSIHGVLPRSQALELLSNSHLAVVLAQEQPMCVPAKIYESVGLGVPTLVIAERHSAAASEAKRIGAMTLESDDIQGMEALLKTMLDGSMPLRMDSTASISYEALAAQMDRLVVEANTR